MPIPLMFKDRDYVVKDGEIIIVDEFTGRLMPGRRYSNGLHQAIEAKEKTLRSTGNPKPWQPLPSRTILECLISCLG